MKAYLINPFDQTVTQVDFTGNYKNIYTHIQADMFTTVEMNEQMDTVWIDDEGLLKDLENQAFFTIKGYKQPLAGRGLVLGCDDEGVSVEPKISIEEVILSVKFLSLVEVRFLAEIGAV
jgi:hypothetical protein